MPVSQSVSRQQFLCYEGESDSQDDTESGGEIDDGKNRIVGRR